MGAFSAIASVAAPVIGGLFGKKSAGTAAEQSTQGIEEALGELSGVRGEVGSNIERILNLFAPFRETGGGAMDLLENILVHGKGRRKFRESPGFRFALGEGNRNLRSAQRAAGISESGPAMKEFMQFGQGLASQDFNNWIRNLFGLANFGTIGTTASANAIAGQNNILGNLGLGAADLLTRAGDVNADATLAGHSSLFGGINQGINNLLALNRDQQMLEAIGAMGTGVP